MVLQELFTWQISFVFGLLLLSGIYGRGWAKHRANNPDLIKSWHFYLFFLGLILIATATISQLSMWALDTYTARAIQHILLTGLIPLCLIVSNGFVVLWDGLPKWIRGDNASSAAPSPTYQFLRKLIASITTPTITWTFFVIAIWLWNDPTMIELTRTYSWVHAIEMTSLLLIAIVFWWHIAGIKPHIHKPMKHGLRMAYAYAGMIPTKLLGFMLLFGTAPQESSAEPFITLSGMHFSDQGFAAMIIWMIGGLTYTYTATFLAGQLFDIEDKKPPIAQSIITDEETWRAPGFGNSSSKRR